MTCKWQEVVIEDIAERVAMGPFGSNIKTDNFVISGVPIIRGGNLNEGRFHDEDFVFLTEEKADELRSANAFPGDIVFTHRGTLGQVGIIPTSAKYPRYVVSQSQMKLTCDTRKADSLFVFYFFRSVRGQQELLSNTSTTGVPAISRPLTSLKKIRLKLPPVPIQHAIACILGALDDKIENNRRMNETLEEMARAIFKSWFVDFDPVHAKAAARKPSGMDAATAKLFPDSFDDSDIGEIPSGWNVCKVEDLADLNALTLSRNDALDIIDYIEISKVMRGDISEITRYKRGTEPSRARRRLRHGDTVLSTVRPDRGAYFLCLNPPNTLIASTGFVVATPKNGCWAFLHAALTQTEVGEELGHLADGGAYPAVLPEVIGRVTVIAPRDRQIVDMFERTVQPLYEKADGNRMESDTLASIRDALLPKLLSGEIRIMDAEKFMEGTI